MRNPIFSIWKGHQNYSRCSVIGSMAQLFRFIVSPLRIVISSKITHGDQSGGVIGSEYSFSFLQALPVKLLRFSIFPLITVIVSKITHGGQSGGVIGSE